jgi:DNA polymerase-3 subunit delta'
MDIIQKQIDDGNVTNSYIIVTNNNSITLGKIFDFAKNNKISKFDTNLLDSVEKIKISEIKEIQKKISLRPYSGKYNLTIINNAENLTTEASNSLLKTLEEPPKYSLILMICERKDSILPTIYSRCQVIHDFSTNLISDDDFTKISNQIQGIMKMSVSEKFALANKLSVSEDLDQTLLNWLVYFKKDIYNSNSVRLIKNINKSINNIKFTNANKKLILENLLLLF